MAWRLSSSGRAGMLVVAAALIGGPGCLTMTAVSEAQRAGAQRAREAERKEELARRGSEAASGKIEGVIAYWHLVRYRREPADYDRALGYLERAAVAGSAPARYEYGQAILRAALSGNAHPSPAQLAQAGRGLALVKGTAAVACHLRIPARAPYTVEPAREVANLYRSWPQLREDDAEAANVWFARSIITCGSPGVDQVAHWSGQDPDPDLWRYTLDQLRPSHTVAPTGLTPESQAAALARAQRWRAAALATRRDYPFPPDAISR